MKILYISGAFSTLPEGYDELHGVQQNILTASRYALMAARKGWMPLTPHKNTADFQHIQDIDYHFWLKGCLELVRRSDAILIIPGWENSHGAVREKQVADVRSIPIYTPETLPEVMP